MVIQVGGDLYLSDAGLTSLWSPKAPAPGQCPYPGLDAFGPGQAKWFYGREHVTSELLRHLDEMTLGGASGPLLVVAFQQPDHADELRRWIAARGWAGLLA